MNKKKSAIYTPQSIYQKLVEKRMVTVVILVFAVLGSVLLWRSFAANANLKGDLDGDNVVGTHDLSLLLGNFNKVSTADDLNGDGKITARDLAILLANYGKRFTPPTPTPAPTPAPTPTPPPPAPTPTPAPTPAPTPTPTPAPADGTQAATALNWGAVVNGDEFEYTGAPNSKWGMYNGPGHNGNGLRRPSAFSVHNGILTVHGDTGGTTGGMAFSGASGKTYRDEVRAKMYATGAGSGSQYHPVLIRWPDSDSWPQGGEDDYMETNIGDSGIQAFIHHPNQGSGSSQSSASKTIDITQWHNYAIERSNSRIAGFVDGVKWFDFTMSETNGQVPGPMHPTIQLDNFGGATHKEANFDVAWYRIYTAP